MFQIADKLGIGVYSPSEAAFYARVPRRIMMRWVFGDASGKAVVESQLRDPAEKVVTFLDFVQTLAIREVRNRHGLSLQKIRQGVDAARDHYGIDYPLARNHTIYLFGDQKGEGHGQLVIKLSDDADRIEDRYVQLTGRDRGNLMIARVVEMFLDDLRFDPETGLASQYSPMAAHGAAIILNPHRGFGEPIVEPGGYTAETLWHATNTEGGIKAAAEAFGVSEGEVTLANKYYDSLIQDRVA